MATNVIDSTGDQFYDLSLPVFPGEVKAHRPDIMLVQFLIQHFFSLKGHRASDLAQFASILKRASVRGHRFDDGKYGPLTREATFLYEKISKAPFKDGIFRVAGAHIEDSERMKIKHLNSMFSVLVPEAAKKAFVRTNGNPLLFDQLYPAG